MADSKSQMRLAVLGAGKMGGILIEAFVKQGLVSPKNVFATVAHPGQSRRILSAYSITPSKNNRAAAKNADVIFLCVKPGGIGNLVEEIRRELSEKKLVISI